MNKESSMNIGRIVNAFAGTMVMGSVALAVYVDINWLWLTAFAGANLFQSAFTGFCLPAIVLRKLGAKPGTAF